MDGLEMIHRANQEKLHVIFITGYKEFEAAREAIRLGADDFLLKPVSNPELLEAIRRIDSAGQPQPEPEQFAGRQLSFLVQNVLAYIRKNYADNLTLKKLSTIFYVNPNYLSTIFKKETGINFVDMITDIRIENAKHLLHDASLSINDVGTACGFKDYVYFYQVFRKRVGESPSEYRKSTCLNG